MLALVLASVTVILLLGYFSGPARKACDCQRCWYVNEPPEGTPECHGLPVSFSPAAKLIAFATVAALGMLFMRGVKGNGGKSVADLLNGETS